MTACAHWHAKDGSCLIPEAVKQCIDPQGKVCGYLDESNAPALPLYIPLTDVCALCQREVAAAYERAKTFCSDAQLRTVLFTVMGREPTQQQIIRLRATLLGVVRLAGFSGFARAPSMPTL